MDSFLAILKYFDKEQMINTLKIHKFEIPCPGKIFKRKKQGRWISIPPESSYQNQTERSWPSFVHIPILTYYYSKFIFTEAFSNSCETWYYDSESAHHYLYMYEFLNKFLEPWKDTSSPQAQTKKILQIQAEKKTMKQKKPSKYLIQNQAKLRGFKLLTCSF